MPQFHIDEVCPKDSVYPIVVTFQNVYINEKFETHDCLLLEDEKAGKKKIITQLYDTMYSGEEENEDLGKTLILARNKTTGKVRLIEVGKIELKPVIKSDLDTTEVMDTSRLELSKKFGWKSHNQIIEQCEKIEITVEMGREQLQNVMEDKLDLPSYNKIDSDEFYIPPINRDATKVDEVYNIDKILTLEQFEKIYSEIEGTEYTSNLNPFLKSIATKTLSPKHTVLLVYANTLLQLNGTRMKDISRKNFTACQYSVTLNKIVMNNFLTNINGKWGRTPQYKDKSLCHALVFILLINNYMFNFDDLCQQLKLTIRMGSSKLALTGATLVSVGNKKIAQLKLETKDDVKTKTKSIKPISKVKEPIISDAISNRNVNRNIDKEIARTIHNDYTNICTEEKPYKCDICQSSFDSKYNLSAHIQPGEKPYKCDTCPSSFNLFCTLKRHIRCSHSDEKPFKCNICQNSFNLSSTLKRHIRHMHSGEKPYKCDICRRRFNLSSTLKRHIRHMHSGEKPYKCDECQCSFYHPGNLKRHIHCAHTGVKPYKCDLCPCSYNLSCTLKRHIRHMHSGEKLYKCDGCRSTFYESSNLERHVRHKHTNEYENPYKCDICPSSFTRICSLIDHISKHNGEKSFKCGFISE